MKKKDTIKNTSATLNQSDIIAAMLGGAVLVLSDHRYQLALLDGSRAPVTPGRAKRLGERRYLCPIMLSMSGRQWTLWPHVAQQLAKRKL